MLPDCGASGMAKRATNTHAVHCQCGRLWAARRRPHDDDERTLYVYTFFVRAALFLSRFFVTRQLWYSHHLCALAVGRHCRVVQRNPANGMRYSDAEALGRILCSDV